MAIYVKIVRLFHKNGSISAKMALFSTQNHRWKARESFIIFQKEYGRNNLSRCAFIGNNMAWLLVFGLISQLIAQYSHQIWNTTAWEETWTEVKNKSQSNFFIKIALIPILTEVWLKDTCYALSKNSTNQLLLDIQAYN